MLVLLLFTTVSAINLTQFENFKIALDAKSQEYFLFQGERDYAYFYQKNGQFELWVTRNLSHEIYTSPYSDVLLFEWPDKLINGNPMTLVLHEGVIEYPLKFDTEIFLSNIFGIAAGSFYYEEPTLDVFKCPPSKDWIINITLAGLVILILILLGVKHESIEALLGPKISRVIRWSRALLSRSSQTVSSDNSEEDYTIPQVSECLHST